MQIGQLRKRIVIEYPSLVPDGMGGFTTTWNTAATVWAAMWQTSGQEQVASLQSQQEIITRIRIRYRSVLYSGWRFRYGRRYFNILNIINQDERNAWQDVLCKEIQ